MHGLGLRRSLWATQACILWPVPLTMKLYESKRHRDVLQQRSPQLGVWVYYILYLYTVFLSITYIVFLQGAQLFETLRNYLRVSLLIHCQLFRLYNILYTFCLILRRYTWEGMCHWGHEHMYACKWNSCYLSRVYMPSETLMANVLFS